MKPRSPTLSQQSCRRQHQQHVASKSHTSIIDTRSYQQSRCALSLSLSRGTRYHACLFLLFFVLFVASSSDDRCRISTEPASFANPIVFISSDNISSNARERKLCNSERHRVPAEIHPICIVVRTIRKRDCSVVADEEDARVASRRVAFSRLQKCTRTGSRVNSRYPRPRDAAGTRIRLDNNYTLRNCSCGISARGCH